MPAAPAAIWTIGHSTRTLEAFLGLLDGHRIEAVADVRRFAGSRRCPHFAGAALAESLPRHGLIYRWLPQLGGRRKVQPGSPNTAWRNASFQGYADFLATAEFAGGLAELLQLAASRRTAMMCAEAVWWRCHRALVSDVLKLRGIRVMHIVDAGAATEHPYTSPARIVQGRLSYAPAAADPP
ncbi:MAG TPA: DUF488 domain-containing protein [Rubrivivax sp.]|nr:DUF488 domain-containing protein [Rubrivivax sp.]